MLYMQPYKLDIKILLSVAFSGPNIGFQFAFLWFYLSQANAQYVIDQMATRKSERLIFFFTDRQVRSERITVVIQPDLILLLSGSDSCICLVALATFKKLLLRFKDIFNLIRVRAYFVGYV